MGQVLALARTAEPRFLQTADIVETGLSVLAGHALGGRFRRWQGASGRRYLFSVFPLVTGCPLDDCPAYVDVVVLAVRRNADGSRTILHAVETGPLPELTLGGQGMRRALADGADECHVHLLTETAADRQAIIADLLG